MDIDKAEQKKKEIEDICKEIWYYKDSPSSRYTYMGAIFKENNDIPRNDDIHSNFKKIIVASNDLLNIIKSGEEELKEKTKSFKQIDDKIDTINNNTLNINQAFSKIDGISGKINTIDSTTASIKGSINSIIQMQSNRKPAAEEQNLNNPVPNLDDSLIDEIEKNLVDTIKDLCAHSKYQNKILDLESEIKNRENALEKKKSDFEDSKKTFDQEKEAFEESKKTFDQEKEAFEESKKTFDQEKEAFEESKKTFDQEKEAFDESKKTFDQEKEAFDESKKTFDQEKKDFENGKGNSTGKVKFRIKNNSEHHRSIMESISIYKKKSQELVISDCVADKYYPVLKSEYDDLKTNYDTLIDAITNDPELSKKTYIMKLINCNNAENTESSSDDNDGE